tara:strand:- start:202 stop:402 length:201 start_codon:yes stop_codon:yes gene_type:complete
MFTKEQKLLNNSFPFIQLKNPSHKGGFFYSLQKKLLRYHIPERAAPLMILDVKLMGHKKGCSPAIK